MMNDAKLNYLINKYNVAAPRYTSYPTVPFWENELFSEEGWIKYVKYRYHKSAKQGISLYIHLPFCESLCTYCGCNTRITKNHMVETPYIDAVLKEWSMYKEILGQSPILISELHLGGGTPTFFNPSNLKKLIHGITDGNIIAENASFSFEAHPANTTKEHLETLYALGFTRLSLGIQDFDTQVQHIINRKQTVQDVQEVMKLAREIGYESINFDLIYGLPLQTMESIRQTVELSMEMAPDRISFYSYAHVPWIKPGQRKFTEHDLPAGHDKLNLYQLGKTLIQSYGYRDVGMDHFSKEDDQLFVASNNGTLHRNFMGYTDLFTPLMIGLGVSSISDAWSAFAQNVKKVEEYYQLVNEGKIPVVKGHILTQEDEMLRQYILDMMCRGAVNLVPHFSLNSKIVERLQPLVEDGLVKIADHRVICTGPGKSFLRNICTAFDQRLHTKRETELLFSQAI